MDITQPTSPAEECTEEYTQQHAQQHSAAGTESLPADTTLNRQMTLLAGLAKANNTHETLELVIEIACALGAEIAGARVIYAERTTEVMTGKTGVGPLVEVAADGGSARLQLVCAGALTADLAQEIEAVAQVAVLRAELCERRLWQGQEHQGEHQGNREAGTQKSLTGMILASDESRQLEREIVRAARSPHSVLITGKTGTGKTTTARAIHELSSRSARPFVEINCAAIPETLLEAELFGFERGAFTGAVTSKRGQFEEADGGTLFLDEVGELTPAMQAKLLKAIEEKSVRRLGASRAVKCNVRLLAATSQNLAEMLRDGRFREDLYYRLEVLEIRTAPLRERRQDIPALIERRLKKEEKLMERHEPFALEQAALEELQNYDWPGNIRQLQNVISKLAAYASDEDPSPITVEDVHRVLYKQNGVDAANTSACQKPAVSSTPLHLIEKAQAGEVGLSPEILRLRAGETLKQYLARVKVCAIETVRRQSNGNMFDAARRLGVAYPTLNQGLKKARTNAA